jgi:hypothetical protein
MMSEAQMQKMMAELKRELERVFKAKGFAGVTKVLLKYHRPGRKATMDTQVLVVGEVIRSPSKRGEFVPLCSLTTTRDAAGRYAGVAFGIVPKATLRMQSSDGHK